MLKQLTILLAVFAAGLGTEEKATEFQGARLLVSKQILNRYLVETKDIEIQYSIHNIGKAPAVDVTLKDYGFAEDAFEFTAGHPQATFPRIPPETNLTHVMIVRPTKYGYFNFTSAEVTYKLSDDKDAQVQVSFTSEPGQGVIASFRDFDKKYSSHFWDWIAFLCMATPSTFIPYLLWHASKSNYEKHNKASKKH